MFSSKIYDEICISLQELYNRPLAKVKPPQSKFHEISEIKSFSDSEFQRLVGVPRPVLVK